MQKQYDGFIERTGTLTFDKFMSHEYIRQLEEAICDKFGFYVVQDAFGLMPLDEFIRFLPDGDESKYWLWATVDYHY